MDIVLVSSFVFMSDINFSHKILLLVNSNAEKICCNFSYKNLFYNVGIMRASRLWSFYSINFQIRQISVSNQHFFLGITTLFQLISLTVVWVEVFEKKKNKKKTIFSSLRSCYHRQANRKALILPLEKYLKILNDMIIDTTGT